MRAFADLLETTAPVGDGTAPRNLTSVAAVKTALSIVDGDSDALIADLIPKVTQLIVDECRLARDVAGSIPTFGRETLRATWYPDIGGRGCELWLPWRPPVFSIDSVVEGGVLLTAGTDFVLLGGKSGPLRRLSSDNPVFWNANKIVVTWKAGFDTETDLASHIDAALKSAAIEQVKSMLFAADRDPSLRSETVYDIGAATYSQPGGDTLGALSAPFLLASVRAMIAPWRNPLP